MRYRTLRKLALAIAVITLATGLFEIPGASLELRILNTPDTAATRQLLGTVGMFMLLFGGLVAHAIIQERESQRLVLFWAILQKFGAVAAVCLAVVHGVFSALALGVATFDFASAFVLWWYRAELVREPRINEPAPARPALE